MEEWVEIDGFPRYAVSTRGRIKDVLKHRDLVQTMVQQGIPTVGLFLDGVVHRRSVPLLVALHWLPNEEGYPFDTPIQLDGDRRNCDVRNLMWRPRWFAMKYHKEKTYHEIAIDFRFIVVHDGDSMDGVFTSIRDASMKYGFLEQDILDSIDFGKPVWPGNVHFRTF